MNTHSLSGRAILLVEDEPLIMMDVADQLRRAGATVTCVRTLQSALDAIRHSVFDAAVLDYRLPDGKSTHICEQLEVRKIPFVIHSGYEAMNDACENGVKVEKPADAIDIVKVLVDIIV